MKLSGDGRWLAVLSPEAANRRVWLVEMATGRLVPIPGVEAPANPFHPWRFSADGRWFVCPQQRGDRSGLYVWDLKRDREHAFLNPAYPPFAISPDGDHLISYVGEDWVNSRGVGVWDVPGAKLTGHFDNPHSPYSDFGYPVTYSPDGRVIIQVSNYAGRYPVGAGRRTPVSSWLPPRRWKLACYRTVKWSALLATIIIKVSSTCPERKSNSGRPYPSTAAAHGAPMAASLPRGPRKTLQSWLIGRSSTISAGCSRIPDSGSIFTTRSLDADRATCG